MHLDCGHRSGTDYRTNHAAERLAVHDRSSVRQNCQKRNEYRQHHDEESPSGEIEGGSRQGRLVPLKVALCRLVLMKTAPVKLALLKVALAKFELTKRALTRWVRVRSA